jgi:hypothetical protein
MFAALYYPFVFTTRFQIVYLVGTLAVFAAVAFFSRAGARRVAGALCSVLVFTALSAPIDNFGARHDLWTYPSCQNPAHPPLAVYVGQALMFVGTMALIGWRVQRRFGLRGVAWLAAIVCALGAIRDFSVAAALPDLLRFGPMPAALFADLAAWAIIVLVALGVTRLVAGPAAADALRRG